MAASTSNANQIFYPNVNQYPHPSHVFVPSFITVKLNGKNTYNVWNYQMMCLLRSHDMVGFINGNYVCPNNTINQKAKEEDMEAWNRSDSLVQGWIIGSLSDQVAMNVVDRLKSKNGNKDFTAKDAWDVLQRMYSPAQHKQPAASELHRSALKSKDDQVSEEFKRDLYSVIVQGRDPKRLNIYIYEHGYGYEYSNISTTVKLTTNGDTALHVAIGSSTNNQELFKIMLEALPETINLWDVRNLDGSTLLHVAAIVGNTAAAEILLKKCPDLLLAKDNKGHTPLAISLSNMQFQTSFCMLDNIKAGEESTKYDSLFTGPSGDELLVLAISSKNFRLARRLFWHYKAIHSEAVLMAIVQNFQSDLGFLRRLALWLFHGELPYHDESARSIMEDIYRLIKESTHFSNHHLYYSKPIFEATRQNKYKVVTSIVNSFPDAVWSVNEDGYNFIQYAVINRSENIYCMLYKMSDHRNIYKTMEDSSGNNLLHLAARLAPTNKLKTISGAALQMQRELQWFKEVEGFVCPLNTTQKNSSGETPEMIFSREHKELVIEGEEWMKKTAESYTITSALITTIVFASAITVPGGNDQNKGTPIFTNKVAFTVFAISDAISLFTAVTSLLMFLSILTTRFAEEDFLYKLPKRLIIGLATLFISTTAMIIAFGATLFLVFGQGSLGVLIPIGALTCLPIISFVTLQYPLIIDLISTTYGPSIFDRRKSGIPIF